MSVSDINETPEFTSDTSASVSESDSAGATVTDVNANVDGSDDQGVSYDITAGNDGGAFAIDSATGTVRVNDTADIDESAQSCFTVTVEADTGKRNIE